MLDPKLILLDEPAGGINPTLIERMGDMIRELNRQGTTFLIVEHNMPFVLGLCDPVLVLARGTASARARPTRSSRTRASSTPTSARTSCSRRSAPDGRRELLTPAAAWSPATAAATSCRASTSRSREGAIACIVGPNGAGKSTVLRAVSGLLGRARARSSSRASRSPAAPRARSSRAGIAQVPQSERALPEHHGARERADGRLHPPPRPGAAEAPLRRGRGAVPGRRASAPPRRPATSPAASGGWSSSRAR